MVPCLQDPHLLWLPQGEKTKESGRCGKDSLAFSHEEKGLMQDFIQDFELGGGNRMVAGW